MDQCCRNHGTCRTKLAKTMVPCTSVRVCPGGQPFTSLQQALQEAQNDKMRNQTAVDMKTIQTDSFDRNPNIHGNVMAGITRSKITFDAIIFFQPLLGEIHNRQDLQLSERWKKCMKSSGVLVVFEICLDCSGVGQVFRCWACGSPQERTGMKARWKWGMGEVSATLHSAAEFHTRMQVK